MYLMRIGPTGSERPVVRIDDTHYVDVSDVVSDFDEAFFGGDGITSLSGLVSERVSAGHLTAFSGERVGAPIARPHQILCIGLNYSDHAAETGAPVPDEPILFTKSPNTLIGPNDDVRIPRGSTKADWEVELGVVIARRCRQIELPGVPLGSFFGVTYDELTLPLALNDVFVFCSDGVFEAMNSRFEEFTADRLLDVVRKTRDRNAREIVHAIVEAVAEHRAGHPPNDDTTVVVLKLTESTKP